MEHQTVNFGEHLMLDGYMGDKVLLADKNAVLKWLSELPNLLGMHKISEPQIVVFPGNDKKDPGGISGVVMIAESHISVHTFVNRRFVSADVYTCANELDTEFIIDYFKKTFCCNDVETNFIKRGTRYPAVNIE